jgi:TonB family protein
LDRSYNPAVRQDYLIRWFAGLVLVTLLAVVPVPVQAASEIERDLRDRYQHKTFLLRGFYSGNSLHFDAAGTPQEGESHGDWTVDGVVLVDDVSISRDHLRIRATRLHLGWDHNAGLEAVHDYDDKGKLVSDDNKNRKLQIEADLGAGVTPASAEAALSRIFLTSDDSFADLVPNYWKPCVRSGLRTGVIPKDERTSPQCRFSPEFLAVPGVALRSGSSGSADAAHSDTKRLPLEGGVFRIGEGVAPPKVTFQKDPEFTNAARQAKFQGTLTLGLVVDSSGTPTHIHILRPLGCGLDAQAVRSVGAWSFKAAAKDGQPVAVEIAVEVEFHLY